MLTKKYSSLTLIQKKEIVEKSVHSSYNQLAIEYGVSKSTIQSIVRRNEAILDAVDAGGSGAKRMRCRTAKLPDLDNAVLTFLKQARSQNIPISGSLLKVCHLRDVRNLKMSDAEAGERLSLNEADDIGESETAETGEMEQNAADMDDPDLEAIRRRVKEMEEEAQKIREMQAEVEKQMNMSAGSGVGGSPLNMSVEEKMEADARSVYVGNVDYSATAEELESHFHGCGSINRVTILCDKFTGHPKGFAYVEFADKDSVQTAAALDDSLFRGRQIKVVPKRTNRPGISSTNRPPRGRGGRTRVIVKYVYGSGPPRRGRGVYSRRRNFYSPY